MEQTTKTMTTKDAKMDWYLQAVYQALLEKGYAPLDQITGYLISGDPTYITSHNHARCLAARIDREALVRRAIEQYIGTLQQGGSRP